MRSAGLVVAVLLAILLPGLSWGVPPAPWAGGPTGEHSVAGGRSIRKPGPPPGASAGRGSSGKLNVIVLGVQFSDVSFETGSTKSFFKSVLNTVTDYYRDVSEGMLKLNFTVSDGAYTMNRPLSHYGDEKRGGARALVMDAVRAADRSIDFSKFDALMIIHAGVGEESLGKGDGPEIWSQRVGFPTIKVDGVEVLGGMVVPEKEKTAGRGIVGVIAHQIGHELGLPDLYDVDGSSSGIGGWGLMGSGCWGGNGAMPAEPTAWSKIFLGWASVTLQSSDRIGFQLPPASEGNQVVKVKARGYPDSAEYFLLEYRRRTSWDRSLPGEGLLIWHVDEEVGRLQTIVDSGCKNNRWVCNEVNTDEGHKYIDLEAADGFVDLDIAHNRGDAGDPFSEGGSFADSALVDSNNDAGEATGVSVADISPPGERMTFNLSLGFHVKSVLLVDYKTLDVEYNRPVNAAPAADNYTLSSIRHGKPVHPAAATRLKDGVTVRLRFAAPIVTGEIHRLTVKNESDSGYTPLQFNSTVIDNPWGTNATVILDGHTVWDAAGSPYYITSDLFIENHLSLTITEGAVVRFKKAADSDQVNIIVSGLLKIQGGENNPVLITSAGRAVPGEWGSIRFAEDADDRSVISHAVLENGTRGITLSSASPTLSASTFRNFSETGVTSFGDSSPLIKGNTFTGNLTGVSCWENSRPRITGNLIADNDWGVVCGNSAVPRIIGNSFEGNDKIGLSMQDRVGKLNPIIVGNNFLNHPAGWGIYAFKNQVDAPHNFFKGNKADAGTRKGTVNIVPKMSFPLDRSFSPSAISFKDSAYEAAVSSLAADSMLYVQLEGTGGDPAVNSVLVHIKSSNTDSRGIYLHLNETGGGTGIYRTAETSENQASVGALTDRSLFRLGAGAGETITASLASDPSVASTVEIFQCLKGDADGDGSVEIADIIDLFRIGFHLDPQPQTEEQRCTQDLDENNEVTLRDAFRAVGILLGL